MVDSPYTVPMARRPETLDVLLDIRNVTRIELIYYSGLSRQTIYNLVSGRTDAYTTTLTAVATALGVPVERVLRAFLHTRENAQVLVAG